MRPDGLVQPDGSVILAGNHGPALQIPDGFDIFTARFERDGDDLVIAAEGSPPLSVLEYFAAATPPALVAPNGAMLTGGVVEHLAGPRAPAQYAQAEGPEGAVPIGQVETLTGVSTATRVTGETVELGRGDPVFEGDVLETGGDATLGIRLEDGTLASMSAQSRLVLDEFVFEAGGSDNWMIVDLVEGAFAFLTGAIAPSGGMEITTPVAVMAIRGTMPIALVAEGGASRFFAGSDQDYQLLHLTTRELLAVVSSESGYALASPDAPLETIEVDPETLDEINNLLDVLNDTAAALDQDIHTATPFPTNNGFGSIDGNLAALAEFLLLLQGTANEEELVEFERASHFMAEADLVAAPDEGVTQEMTPVIIDVLDNDSHSEGGDLTVISAEVPHGQGTVTIVNNQSVAYDPGSVFDHLALGETANVVISYVVAHESGAQTSSTVTVTVTGLNEAPVIAEVAGTSLDEQTDTEPLQTTIEVTFTDGDLNNVGHEAVITGVSVAGATGGLALEDAGLIALLSAAVTKNAGEGIGTVDIAFSAASPVFDYLAEGEVVTLTYAMEIDDQDGGTDSRSFDVVITGTNDAPVIDVELSDIADTVVEDGFDADHNPVGKPSASGQIEASDIDNGGTFYSVAPLAGSFGILTIDAAGAWAYTLDDAAADHLALGESGTDVFTVTVTDGFGATDEVQVTLTITGSNDDPVIVAETTDDSGAVTELANQTGSDHVHQADGTITFDDADVSDTHGAVSAADGAGYLGSFELGEVDPVTRTVNWSFTVADSDLDPLPNNAILTQSYTVTVGDGNGGTVEQVVTITITGNNDAPTIVVGDGDSDSAVLEEADEGLQADGTLTVSDVSVSDVVTAQVTGVVASGDHSTLVANDTLLGFLTVSSPVIGSTDALGTLAWAFDSNGEAFDFLANGEDLVLTYTIEVDDGTTTASSEVTVTINGTNDGPTINVAAETGAVIEDEDVAGGNLGDSGTITFDDLDLSDGHAVTVAADANNPLGGALTATVTDSATGAGPGTMTWTYTLANAAAQFLAAGETRQEIFTVTVDDGQGGTIDQVVTVTVTGTNDLPVIGVADGSGAVTEDVAVAGGKLSDSGTISFEDVDLIDGHDVTVAAHGANPLGGALTATVTDSATGAGPGTVTWTYTLANAAAQFLAAGETRQETFTVTVDDGEGGTDTQNVTVTITGTNDGPVIGAADGSGAVTEDVAVAGGNLGDSGTISFDDVDLIDGHDVTVTAHAGNPLGGSLTATVTDPATGAGPGTVTWSYTLANAAAQFLAAGETRQETFTVTLDDGEGGTADKVVTVTITGTNDLPVISAADASGAVIEDVGVAKGSIRDSGTISFDDVDLIDGHAVTVAADDDNPLGGTLTTKVTHPATGSGPGTVTWTYTLANAAAQFLAAGETRQEFFTVTIDDGEDGTVDQVVAITVTGTNDLPVIGAADTSGAVNEDVGVSGGNLGDSGTITFDDVDLIDGHGVTVAAAGANPLGGTLTAGITDPATGAGPGTVTWSYSLANAAVQFLAAGEIRQETFTVTIDDGEGGTDTQDVTVTITGTNDAPVISAAVDSGAVTEDVDVAKGSIWDSGTITFDDVDLIDGHTVTVAADADNPLGGTLTTEVTQPATGSGPGTVIWTYTLANAAAQFLAAGETRQESFIVTIDDGEGGTIDQVVAITVIGANDVPVISAADASGTVTEDVDVAGGSIADSGTITFDDLDLIDGHSVTVAADGANPLGGSLSATVTDSATGAGPGTVTWTYTLANAAVQFLAAGEIRQETFTVTVDDGEGGTDSQDVTVTITGTNDAPLISVQAGDSATGDISEITGRTGSTHQHAVEGTLTFSDVDILDTGHTVQTGVAEVSGAVDGLRLTPQELGEFFSATVTEQTGIEATVGQIGWSFAAEDAVFDYLGDGEVLVVTYTVTVTDPTGGSSSRDVEITVHGASEGPVFDFVVSDYSGGQGQSDFRNIEAGTLKDDSIHLLLTATAEGTQVDSSNNDIGVGPANRRVNAGEGVRAEVVTNASGDQKSIGTLNYSAHLMALAFTVTMATVHGDPATALVRVVNADDDNNFNTDGDAGDIVTDIALIRVINDGQVVREVTDFEVNGDYVVIEGLQSGDSLTVIAAEPFNRVEIVNGADGVDPETGTVYGGGDFLLADFGFDLEQIITGTDGDDFLLGTDGDDVLIGLAGLDTLEGGGGDDVFVLTDLTIHDVIVDYHDGDVVDLTRLGFELATGEFTADAAAEFVQYDSATGELSVDEDGLAGDADFELAAKLATAPASVVVRLTDGNTTAEIEIA